MRATTTPATQATAETTAADAPTQTALPAGFTEFWQAYPRKDGRDKALAEWQGLAPSPELQQTIVRCVLRSAAEQGWNGDRHKFAPLPARWLREQRWKDFSGVAAQPFPASLQSLRAHPQETGTPQKQTHACGRAHQCHAVQPLATMRQRVARLAQTVFRRFGISVSWAPSCGDVGCDDSTSLATGQGAHPFKQGGAA